MKLFTLSILSICLTVGAGQSGAQTPERAISDNPERRGISLLQDAEVKRMSVPPSASRLAHKVAFDPRKSIFVTDLAIMKLFSFDELMETLVRESGSKTLTKELLFQQWWDTANRKTDFNLAYGGPNCDAMLSNGSPSLNGFPYTCPRDEGQQIMFNAFGQSTPATYTAIALSNRFDLTTLPEDGGTDCGEYRIVFERRSGISDALDRNLIIFEAVLPNPQPHAHSLSGCRVVQEFWEDLSDLPINERAKRLHDFYYKGIPRAHVEPVVKWTHYGSSTKQALGQVRTNQFMPVPNHEALPPPPNHGNWMLREFHIVKDKDSLKFIPTENAANALATLFDEKNIQSQAVAFRSDFLSQVASLSTPNINTFSMSIKEQYDSGESEEATPGPMVYITAFANSPNFKAQIQSKIPSASGLTPEDIISRAQTQTCAGCHQLSIGTQLGGTLGTWPATLGFTHERLAQPFENTPEGPRYAISEALTNVFLPFRTKIITDFLQGP